MHYCSLYNHNQDVIETMSKVLQQSSYLWFWTALARTMIITFRTQMVTHSMRGLYGMHQTVRLGWSQFHAIQNPSKHTVTKLWTRHNKTPEISLSDPDPFTQEIWLVSDWHQLKLLQSSVKNYLKIPSMQYVSQCRIKSWPRLTLTLDKKVLQKTTVFQQFVKICAGLF